MPSALEPLRRQLAALRKATRRALAADGLARVGATLVGAAFLSFALDFTLELDRPGRAFLGLLLVAGIAWVSRRHLVRPLSQPIPDLALASLLERRRPELWSTLSSALAFESALSSASAEPDGADRGMMLRAIAEAESIVASERALVRGLVPGRFLARRVLALGGIVVLAAVALSLAGNLAVIWFQRNVLLSGQGWPKPTTLFIEGTTDGVIRVARGDSIDLQVRAEGQTPARVQLAADFEDGGRLREPLSATGDERRFVITLANLVSGCTLTASARRSHSAEARIEIVPRPVPSQLVAEVEFPGYLARAPESFAAPTTLEVPAGAKLTMTGQSDKPLAEAWLAVGDLKQPLTLSGSNQFAGSFVPAASGVLQLGMRDSDGLQPETPPRIDLAVAPDAVPDVVLTPKGVSAIITPQAAIRWSLHAADDHGLVGCALVVTTRRGEEQKDERRNQGEGLTARVRSFETAGVLDAQPLALEPGNVLRFVGDATDANDISGPGVGVSESFELKVVSVPDFETEMHRRQLELRREFERVVADQTKLVEDLRAIIPAGDGVPAGNPTEVATRLERLERAIGRRTSGVAAHFLQILEELETNRLAAEDERRRVVDEITRPLEDVAAGNLRVAADMLADAGRALAGAPTAASGAESLQSALSTAEEALSIMSRVLANMMKQVTFSEVLSTLREVIRLHGRAGQEVEAERRRRILDVLDDDGEKNK